MEEVLAKIEELRLEQRELAFAQFNEDTAWEIGSRIRQRAAENGFPVAVCITVNRRRLFSCSMPGAAVINDDWVKRKENMVYRFQKSSYEMALYTRMKGYDLRQQYGFEPCEYAAAGGSVPIVLRGTGVVGAITVSGLAEHEDHGLAVWAIREYLENKAAQ